MIARMDLADQPRPSYVDDGRGGDDFLTRAGLRQLLADAQRGDIIVCRDQSRIGRDAIEVTLVVRDLVRDRGCRLFYYATGQEVLRERDRSGDDVHPGHRPPDGARGDPFAHP